MSVLSNTIGRSLTMSSTTIVRALDKPASLNAQFAMKSLKKTLVSILTKLKRNGIAVALANCCHAIAIMINGCSSNNKSFPQLHRRSTPWLTAQNPSFSFFLSFKPLEAI